jgi:hypothetical protein
MKTKRSSFRWGVALLLLFLACTRAASAQSDLTQTPGPQLSVSPGSLRHAQPPGRETTHQLTLSNRAGSSVEFKINGDSPAGAVLMLHLEEPQGANSFSDSSGRANNGFCPQGACPQTGVQGKFGRAVEFDGQDDFIQTGLHGFPTGNGDRTMAGWVRLNSYVNDWKSAFLFGYGNFGERDQLYSLEMAGSFLYFSQWGHVLFGPCLHLDRWYHVAVTNSGNLVKLYVDGVKVAEKQFELDTQIGTPFTMGRGMADLYGGGRLDGRLDEVMVADRAFTPAEITSLYQFSTAINVPWLTASSLSGTLKPGASLPLQLRLNSRTTPPGRYAAGLLVWSSYPGDPQIHLPVAMDVFHSMYLPRLDQLP